MTPATLSGPESARRRRTPRGGACDEPPRLFGDAPAPAIVAPPTEAPVAPPIEAPVAVATFAEVVAGAWTGLAVAADPVTCLACGGSMRPRWSAGAGVVGGRCEGCGTTLD